MVSVVSSIRRRLQRHAGYSMLEITVVLLIVAIFLALTAPAFLAQQGRAQDISSRTQLSSVLKYAKSDSIDRAGVYGTASQVAAFVQNSDPSLSMIAGPGPASTSYVRVESAGGSNLYVKTKSKSGNTCTAIVTGYVPSYNCAPDGYSLLPLIYLNYDPYTATLTTWTAQTTGTPNNQITTSPLTTSGDWDTSADGNNVVQAEGLTLKFYDWDGPVTYLNATCASSDVNPIVGPQLSPDQRYVYYTCRDTSAGPTTAKMYKMDTTTGVATQTGSTGSRWYNGPGDLNSNGTKWTYCVPQAPSGCIIATSDIDGSNQALLTSVVTSGAWNSSDLNPMWSADGSKIAFASDRGHPTLTVYDLWTINSNGTSLTKVTGTLADNSTFPPALQHVRWSPDGTKLMWGELGNLYSIPAAGGTKTVVASQLNRQFIPVNWH